MLVLSKIARTVFDNGKLKNDSVAALAKACMFTQVNQFLQAEAKDQAYNNYQGTLKDRDRATANAAARVRSDFVPPPGSY